MLPHIKKLVKIDYENHNWRAKERVKYDDDQKQKFTGQWIT